MAASLLLTVMDGCGGVVAGGCAGPQVVAVTGRLLKSDERQLEALVLRGRAYFYLNGRWWAISHRQRCAPVPWWWWWWW